MIVPQPRALRRLLRVLAALALSGGLAFNACAPAFAQESGDGDQLQLVRDEEIESDIRTMATPIWQAAGLDAGAVRVILVQDDVLNAFVAGGQNIFLYTGLLLAVQTPEQLMGVIAHETGHIAGGHLARGQNEMENTSIQQVLLTLLGVAAVVAGGSSGSNAGMAVLAGSSSIAMRSFLKFTRTQEASADQAAVSFLDKIHVTSRGLTEFLKILEARQTYVRGQVDPYLQSHPLTPERVAALEERIGKSPYVDSPAPAAYKVMLERMQGKLRGFVYDPASVVRQIPAGAKGLGDRYARAVALYRLSDVAGAVATIDGLLKDYPNDPYFLELKGQCLFDNGHPADAVAPYQAAVKARPEAPLLRVGLASAMLQAGDPKYTDQAIRDLEAATRADGDNPMAWYQLAVAYGRKGDIGMASLASAERFLLIGDNSGAYTQAERAQKLLPYGSPGSLRAGDIEELAQRLWKKEGRPQHQPFRFGVQTLPNE